MMFGRDRTKTENELSGLRQVFGYAEVRRCLTNILRKLESIEGKIVAVTSLATAEGKSTFTLALSGAAAQYGLKVLILDAATFTRPDSVSIRNILKPNSLNTHSMPSTSTISGVHYLAWTSPLNQRFKDCRMELEQLALPYDLVLIDCVSLTSRNRGNIDPHLCARLADGVVLVSQPKDLVADASGSDDALTDLRESGAKILGVIGNSGISPARKRAPSPIRGEA